MVDTLTRRQRSARMSLIKGKDSKPELLVRRLVHAMGYRYRLHVKGLPGRPDLVFRSRQKIIFVHGCFWHRHQSPICKLARLPKSRLDFWLPKLESNRVRDIHIQKALRAAGWRILVVWECQLGNIERLENKLRVFLEGRNEVNRTVRRRRGAGARR